MAVAQRLDLLRSRNQGPQPKPTAAAQLIARGTPMSRKDELMKLARSLRSQAEGRGPAKRTLRQLADDCEREAQRLSELPQRRDHKKPDRAA